MLNETVTMDIFGQGFPSGAESGIDFLVVLRGKSVNVDLDSDVSVLFKYKILYEFFN